MRRLFRDKFGRFTTDGRKVKSAQIGKKIYKKIDYIKRLLRVEKKKPKPKPKSKPKPKPKPKPKKFIPEIRQEVYQTQLGKLDGTHTQKFERDLSWFEIDTHNKFIKSFKGFYNIIIKKKEKKSTDIKFGFLAKDVETEQYVSKYSNWTDLIFDKNAIKELFENLKNWLDSIIELAKRYKVNITYITQIIMFKVKGHL